MPRCRLPSLIMIVKLVALWPLSEDVIFARYNMQNPGKKIIQQEKFGHSKSRTSRTWQTSPFRHMLPNLRAPVNGRAFVVLDNAMIIHVAFVIHNFLRIISPSRRISVRTWKFKELRVWWQGTIGMRHRVMSTHSQLKALPDRQ